MMALFTGCTDPAWSCTARIARYEFKDQLKDENNLSENPNDPPKILPDHQRSPGFVVFNLSPINPALAAATLEQKMNAWPNPPANVNPGAGSINDNQPQILIDYIDQTPINANADVPQASWPTDPRSGTLPDGTDGTGLPYLNRLVPATPTLSSFYACVDTDKTTAQVFIRGNAYARIKPRNDPPKYDKSASAYFPKSNILVQGRGFIKDGSDNQ
jgi:hypothetical protein